MYLPKGDVTYAPEGGWPDTTAEESSEKTKDVIEMARQMPRIIGKEERGGEHRIYEGDLINVDYNTDPVIATLP